MARVTLLSRPRLWGEDGTPIVANNFRGKKLVSGALQGCVCRQNGGGGVDPCPVMKFGVENCIIVRGGGSVWRTEYFTAENRTS